MERVMTIQNSQATGLLGWARMARNYEGIGDGGPGRAGNWAIEASGVEELGVVDSGTAGSVRTSWGMALNGRGER